MKKTATPSYFTLLHEQTGLAEKTDKEIDEILYGPNDGPCFDRHRIWSDIRDVGNGAWVLIKANVPVDVGSRPLKWGVYWGIPVSDARQQHKDKFGRQAILVNVAPGNPTTLLNTEYIVLDETMFEGLKAEGYYLVERETGVQTHMDLAMLEAGRNLTEEEREVIYALQVDGLTEYQACEEYFLTKHVDANNSNLTYMPTPELTQELEYLYGGMEDL